MSTAISDTPTRSWRNNAERYGTAAEELHELIAQIGYFLIAGHALAALAHHYWWRDNTLLRMHQQRIIYD